MLLPAPYDIFVERGISYGPLVITVYSDLPPLPTPSTPTVTPMGTSGASTWGYHVVARKTSTSQFSAGSPEGATITGNATLDSTNYNRIAWTSVSGANVYDIYRVPPGASPLNPGLIGTTNNTFFNDTGVEGNSVPAPTVGGPGAVVDLTGFVAHAHARRIPDDTVLNNLSPVITDESNGQITIGKFTNEQTLNFTRVTNGKWSLVLENSSGDWLPAITAGAYTVVDSVTRNAPLPIPPPVPPPEPSPYIAYVNEANVFTNVNTFSGLKLNVKVIATDYTLTTLDWGVLVDASGGDVAVQLPPSVGSPSQQYYVNKIDSSVNVVNILPDGSDLIEDATSANLTDRWSDLLLLDGSAGIWILMGGT